MSWAMRARSRSNSRLRAMRSSLFRSRRHDSKKRIPAINAALPVVNEGLNHQVCQKYGSTTMASVSPVSFQGPSLLQAVTWNV